LLTLSCPVKSAKIFYTLNGKYPDEKSEVYSKPLTFKTTTTLKAFAVAPGLDKSFVIGAKFMKIPEKRKISLLTKYSGQYSAGGELALIDFIRGGESFKTGGWQGYEGTDVEALVDLGVLKNICELSLGCYQNQGDWIFMPMEVKFATSADNKNFTELPTVKNQVSEKINGTVIRDFTVKFNGKPVRYIKVHAVNRGNCPAWHPGAGKKAWIFVDEIVIK
jgi:hypothetical protein